MIIKPNQSVYFTTPFDQNERHGIVQEVTSAGYLINNVWYSKGDIQIKNVLLDSKTETDKQLILG